MSEPAKPIAFFDSGVGGLPYLATARRLLPGERFVYAADRRGFPYGSKSRDEVIACALAAVGALVARARPKALVVACNTATELAIDDIRAAHPGLPVVGTVPAIKPAAALSRAGRIGVVATPAAVAAAYLDELAARWAAGLVVVKRGDGELVRFVERSYLSASAEERLAAVRPSVEALLSEGVDAIVLGCTHFLHLYDEFSRAAGLGVAIVDSREGVAARLADILSAEPAALRAADDRNDPAAAGAREPDELYLTGPGGFGEAYEGFARAFGLRPAGLLP